MAVVCDVLKWMPCASGIQAEVNVAGEESSYSGRVAELNPRVDEKAGMVNVTILIAQNNASLLPGSCMCRWCSACRMNSTLLCLRRRW